MLFSTAMRTARLLACAALLSLCSLIVAVPAAETSAVPAQPVVKHSAPYTRLLGTAWPKAPVKFADHKAASAPVQTVGWGHRAYYGAPYAGIGYGYGLPYYAGYYGGYPMGAWSNYTPYTYSYRPWVGGWGGYPYYTGFNPGFGGYYGVGYRTGGYFGGGGGFYGNYGGCCYW